MCKISCTSEQFDVIFEALRYFYWQSEDRLMALYPVNFGSDYERVWRNRLDVCRDLLETLKEDLPF